MELRGVLDAVHQAGLVSVGLIDGSPAIETLATELEMPLLGRFRAQLVSTAPVPVTQPASVEPAPEKPTAEKEPAAREHNLALIHARPVRSGQQLYARNRDLVVMANVGAGAEVIADGCVHVYGVLRGRALAGAQGNRSARVFCQEFQAEMVSIGGIFRVFETLPEDLAGKPVQAWLVKEDLCLARIAPGS
jgi:septum site-determining protein MinC